jgi:hypothetical protein
MKKQIAVALLLFGTSTHCVAAQKSFKPITVGMVALLARPQKYNGKTIETWGYLFIGGMPEQDSLWLREEDGKFMLSKSSFGLDLSPEQRQQFRCLNRTYVLITGTLKSKGPDTPSLNSGTITRITALTGWSPYRPQPCETTTSDHPTP